MFLMLQTTEGVGRDLKSVAFFQAAGFSSPSTGLLRSVNERGFSIYQGNFSNVQLQPERAGFAGLNATSCSIGGFISDFGYRAGIRTSSPQTYLSLLKTPISFARYEKGFSYSSFLASNNSFMASFLGQLQSSGKCSTQPLKKHRFPTFPFLGFQV